jgi:hypothetical protein
MIAASAIEARAERPETGLRKQRTGVPMPVNTRPKAQGYNGRPGQAPAEPPAKPDADRPALLTGATDNDLGERLVATKHHVTTFLSAQSKTNLSKSPCTIAASSRIHT